MPTLRIQHVVRSFDAWNRAFDSDPVGREKGGVRRYQIFRGVNDPNFVMVDLDFDERATAELFHQKLIELWQGAGKAVAVDPQAWIVESAGPVTVTATSTSTR